MGTNNTSEVDVMLGGHGERMTTNKLTPQQIENWRRVLLGQIGPYALLMSNDEVQQEHDRLQEIADSLK
jgi:hypothetical protein